MKEAIRTSGEWVVVPLWKIDDESDENTRQIAITTMGKIFNSSSEDDPGLMSAVSGYKWLNVKDSGSGKKPKPRNRKIVLEAWPRSIYVQNLYMVINIQIRYTNNISNINSTSINTHI